MLFFPSEFALLIGSDRSGIGAMRFAVSRIVRGACGRAAYLFLIVRVGGVAGARREGCRPGVVDDRRGGGLGGGLGADGWAS